MIGPSDTLLAPLLLYVLNGPENLTSLIRLIRASPAASRLFKDCSCEVLEAVMGSSVPCAREILGPAIRILCDNTIREYTS